MKVGGRDGSHCHFFGLRLLTLMGKGLKSFASLRIPRGQKKSRKKVACYFQITG
jgi:hypothetical protein